MTKLLIVYHSQPRNTEAMAKAFYAGVLSSGAMVSLKKAADTTSDDLIDCDAVAMESVERICSGLGFRKAFDNVSTQGKPLF